MNTAFTSAEAQRAVAVLASRPLVRLITEIDDNGAIPPRRLADTLPDLSTHQLRSASEMARAHGLVRSAPGAALELTAAGVGLADLYDAMARWARRHAVPAPVCEFSGRIQYVLDLVAPSLTTERADGAEADLARLRTLLIQWLADNPLVARVSEPEMVA
ncbi:regulator [Streptomyces griseofuscus]|uniref:regulator n=1 Tax=Streptomyces TaxID=1883 RepID=UPI0018F07E3E|nr:regulator [Streptomyces sp. CRPSP2-6A1]MBJ7004884.1 regulator [Streptomyces sp. CRPSP2-6A1]